MREQERFPDLMREWTRAFDHVVEPEQRLNAVLALARPLANAGRAVVLREERILAATPGSIDGAAARRLADRALAVLDDELATPDLYVARIAPHGRERLALRWHSNDGRALAVARALAATCAGALYHATPPADLPGADATLLRLDQLVGDARRMQRAFAVVYVDVEPPGPDREPGVRRTGERSGARERVARTLRRTVRANDHVGHLGGDSFVALLALRSSESEAYVAAQRLLAAASASAAASFAHVGVAICPQDGVAAEELLAKAGAAAMAAASSGDDRLSWYRDAAGRSLRAVAEARARTRDGACGDLFALHWQPLFEAEHGRLDGLIPSVVWRDPVSTLPPPTVVMDDADAATRDAYAVWAVDSAATGRRALAAAGIDVRLHLRVDVASDAFIDAVARLFPNGATRRVGLEITARAVADDVALKSFGRRLRALGPTVGSDVAACSAVGAVLGRNLDFVTMRSGTDKVQTLARLAYAAVIAPVVIVSEVAGASQAQWLARNGASSVLGDALGRAASLSQVAGWASNCWEPVGS